MIRGSPAYNSVCFTVLLWLVSGLSSVKRQGSDAETRPQHSLPKVLDTGELARIKARRLRVARPALSLSFRTLSRTFLKSLVGIRECLSRRLLLRFILLAQSVNSTVIVGNPRRIAAERVCPELAR